MRDMELDKEFEIKESRMDEIIKYLEKMSKKGKQKVQEQKEEKQVTLIYFFSSPNKKGIRMVDCSPKGALARFTGTTGIEEDKLGKKSGTFITRQASFMYVDWDDDLNEVNKATYVKRPVGNNDAVYVIYTFIVSDEELKSIEEQVNTKVPDENNHIIIKVENLYDINQEYRFYKKLVNKNKDSIMDLESKYDGMENVIPEENMITKEDVTDKNKTIELIEKEENILDTNISNVRTSKSVLTNFKKFLGKTFPKNSINKNAYKYDNEENSTGGFNL